MQKKINKFTYRIFALLILSTLVLSSMNINCMAEPISGSTLEENSTNTKFYDFSIDLLEQSQLKT